MVTLVATRAASVATELVSRRHTSTTNVQELTVLAVFRLKLSALGINSMPTYVLSGIWEGKGEVEIGLFLRVPF